jgi:hypothetical protein
VCRTGASIAATIYSTLVAPAASPSDGQEKDVSSSRGLPLDPDLEGGGGGVTHPLR